MSNIISKNVDISRVKTVADWAEVISTSWFRSTEQILLTAQLVLVAEKELDRKSLVSLKKQLPFGAGTYSKLKKIAKTSILNDPDNMIFLPNSFSTIYELTHVSEENIREAIDDGILTSEISRSNIKELRSIIHRPSLKKEGKVVQIEVATIFAESNLDKSSSKKVESLLNQIGEIDGVKVVARSKEFKARLK